MYSEKLVNKARQVESRYIYLFCFFLFMFWQILVIIHYQGWYAIDEPYHISSSNPAFHEASLYDRAPYLNETIRLLTSLFGRSYYTYKLIPFVMSLISMAVILYILKQLTPHSFPALLATLLMGGHSILLFNHLYIRMYVWDEGTIAILAFLLYRFSRTRSVWLRLITHLLYFIVASFMVLFQPREQSSLSVLAVGIAAWIMYMIGYPLLTVLKKKGFLDRILIVIGIFIVIIEAYILCIRSRILPIPHIFPSNISSLLKPLTAESSPDFTLYFLTWGILFTIGLLGYGYLLLKRETKKEILGIYTLAFLPFLTYNMLFFDAGPFRSYVSFLPMVVLFTVLWLDEFSSRKHYYLAAGIAVIATVLFSYRFTGNFNGILRFFITPNILVYLVLFIGLLWPGRFSVRRLCYMVIGFLSAAIIWNLDIAGYYRVPYIYNETNLSNYGGMVDDAIAAVESGRKCISFWHGDHFVATFEPDLKSAYVFSYAASDNQLYEYTEDDLLALLDYFETTDESYVLLLCPHCNWLFGLMTPEILDMILEKYPYDRYEFDGFLVYIN